MARDICLIVVFNHRFDRNLPLLRALYRDRFPHQRFLMPFYDGADHDVIPIYESSDTFQGYFAQARPRFVDPRFSHYVFLGDDVLINPAITQENLCAELALGADDAFLPWMRPFAGFQGQWMHYLPALRAFEAAKRYVQYAAALPARAEAVERFQAHGLPVEPFSWLQAVGTARGSTRAWLRAALFATKQSLRGRRELVYPLVMGYSDFLVVPASAIDAFCHACGVFAAMQLFVEVAAPTALALASRRMVTQQQVRWQGGEMWTKDEKRQLADRYQNDLSQLLAAFPADTLYLHPIKLSQWRMKEAV